MCGSVSAPPMTKATPDHWTLQLQRATEVALTWRKRRKLRKKLRQKQKGVVRDWVEAILSAVVIVLLINQYLLQAYQIPSPSMVPTLLISDRIFVNKIVYGPELIPGMAKIRGFRLPRRGEIIIFESPSYESRGPVIDILQRVIYMMTLSLVDIDRDEYGNPKHHFLIKRAMGMPGDRLRFREGEIEILFPGEDVWRAQPTIRDRMEWDYVTQRRFGPQDYPEFRDYAVASILEEEGLPLTREQERDLARPISTDEYYVQKRSAAMEYQINPGNRFYRAVWHHYQNGFVVGPDEILPLGDNRDNSNDGRYFGPVKLDKVLGRGLFKYWPIGRIGAIR